MEPGFYLSFILLTLFMPRRTVWLPETSNFCLLTRKNASINCFPPSPAMNKGSEALHTAHLGMAKPLGHCASLSLRASGFLAHQGLIHLQYRRPWFDSWVGKICWRKERLQTPVFWPGEFHGLYRPWGHKRVR